MKIIRCFVISVKNSAINVSSSVYFFSILCFNVNGISKERIVKSISIFCALQLTAHAKLLQYVMNLFLIFSFSKQLQGLL